MDRGWHAAGTQEANTAPSHQGASKAALKMRRAIQPKNASLLLNEMRGCMGRVTYEYLDVPLEERERRAYRRNCPLDAVGQFECEVTLGGQTYVGEAHSKAEAKLAAAELAFQGEITRRCAMNVSDAGRPSNEDYCPWTAIASLALHKLYTQWQAQGYAVPKDLMQMQGADILPAGAAVSSVAAGGNSNLEPLGVRSSSGQQQQQLPGPEGKSPVQQLNEMLARLGQPAATFEQLQQTGLPNDPSFLLQVSLMGQTYTGEGRAKKLAKTRAAEKALRDAEAWFVPVLRRRQQEQEAEGGGGGPDSHQDSEEAAVDPAQ